MARSREVIAEAFRRGVERFPGMVVSAADFAAFLDRIATEDERVLRHAEDLFLACACALGVSGAAEFLERSCLVQVPKYVRRYGDRDDFVDEVMQRLRWKLLLDQPPKIATYAGAGPLEAWIRIAAVRIAIDQVSGRDGARAHETESDILDVVGEADPEIETLRRRYGPALQEALHAAIDALSPQHRLLLWFHYAQGFNVDRLGLIYGVHRATAARWVTAVRHELLAQIRNRFKNHCQVSDSEFGSLYRVVQQDLRISFRQLRTPLGEDELRAQLDGPDSAKLHRLPFPPFSTETEPRRPSGDQPRGAVSKATESSK